MRIGAILLAGGRSERMGRPKESLPLHGETMLGRTLACLTGVAAPILVVARDAQQALPPLPPEATRIHDEQPGSGPLGALVTALRWLGDRAGFAAADAAFVTACDQPFLTADAVRWLAARLGEHELVMPRVGGLLQPLCAVYRLAVLPFAERLLATGTVTPRSLAAGASARVLEESEVRAFDPSLRFLQNVNTPEDYRRALGGS
ncbi:MAG: molybdenum cofactor guanylyltransferase [Planctomycetes bacterium]|nr:molybdenum cofactor guanylyltransferase [Planctomycetota bacterium]